MKILFITYDFDPDYNSNFFIIHNLSQAFIHMGHEVHVLPLKPDFDAEAEEVWQNINIHKITDTYDKRQVFQYLLQFKLLSALHLAFSILRDRSNHKDYLKKYWCYFPFKRLRKVIKQHGIDTVINVCDPFEGCQPVMRYLKKYLKKFHWLIYMQTPFAANAYYLDRYQKSDLVDFQTKAMGMADKIVGTASIINELKQDNDLIPHDKYQTLNYPVIVQPQRSYQDDNIPMNRHYINCVYVGQLGKVMENPEILFQMFRKLKKDCIRLHIIGEDIDTWREYLPERNSNIFFYGAKSPEAAKNAKLNANILIHICDNTDHQLPRMLLDNISMGKPIINWYNSEECPVIEYLSKYPYSFIIKESRINQKTVRKLRFFCTRYRKININYPYIENKFYDYTVDYVSKEFLKLCENPDDTINY
ncbi:MAG TPA: hypothetical protein VN258_12705 [Mobilitalea sp.]|nr:hypothetical protein [Mobilitalea sp.]